MRIIHEDISIRDAFEIAVKHDEVVITERGAISPDKIYVPVKVGSEAEGFITIPKKYHSLFTSTKRYSLLTGGRSSGKSYITSVFILMSMLERHTNVLYTRYTLSSMTASIVAETSARIHELGLNEHFDIGKREITMKTLNNTLYFRGIKAGSNNQTANLKSLSEISLWVCDEAEEIPDYDIFEKINLSIRTTRKLNRVVMAMNPTIKSSWQYQHFYTDRKVDAGNCIESQDTTYIHTTYQDLNSEVIADSFIEEALRIKELDYERYENIFLGHWTDKKVGVIFNNWSIKPFPNVESKRVVGLDWGFRDPNAAVEVARVGNDLYVREIYYEAEKTFEEIAHDLKRYKHLQFVCDSARPEGIRAMQHRGYRTTKAKKGANSIIGGIAKLRDYVNIFVAPNSVHLIEELQNYVWNPKYSGDKPIDEFNHLIDALRYANDYMNQHSGEYNIEVLGTMDKNDLANRYIKSLFEGGTSTNHYNIY